MNRLISPMVLRGVLSLIIGVVAVAWPAVTVEAFVLLFAVYAFVIGSSELMRAFQSRSAGPVIGRLALGVLDIAAGIVALAWPGITALTLVILVAVWAFGAGIAEVALAFSSGRTTGERAFLALTGLISIVFGALLAIQPDMGAISLAQVFGFFSIISGVTTLVMAVNTREKADHLASATNLTT